MFRLEGWMPGDTRGFVHKRLLGGIKGFVTSGFSPTAAAAGFLQKPRARATVPRSLTARPSVEGSQQKNFARTLKFGGAEFGGPAPFVPLATTLPAPRSFGIPKGASGIPTSPCRTGETDRCCRLRNGDFNDQRQWQRECGTAGNGAAATGVGAAVMGQYGAALEPGVMQIERSLCLPGMQLAKDGLCYNKGAITNSQRMWPRGRRPLLTGGDMRAIGIAARAGSKLDRTTKRLRALGMMKALPKGRGAPRAHAHAKPVAAVSV